MTDSCQESIYLEDNLGRQVRTEELYPRSTPAGRRIRHAHIQFLVSTYMINLVLLVVIVPQWTWLFTRPMFEPFFSEYNYIFLYLTVLQFFMLLNLIFFFDELLNKSVRLLWVYIIIMLELGCSTFLDLMEATIYDIEYSLIVMAVSYTMSIFMAMFDMSRPRDTLYIITWSVRYLLIVSMISLFMTTFNEIHLEVTITLVLYACIIVFVSSLGLTIGSLEFFGHSQINSILLGVLLYISCASEFAVGATFFRKLRQLDFQNF